MPNFDGSQSNARVELRFDGQRGDVAWRTLVQALVAGGDVLDAFDAFLWALRSLDPLPGGTKTCRVFVSHQRADAAYARRIAWCAVQERFEYWLDVHDPLLRWVNSAPISPQTHSILVAAIIEIALLNCTHVIAVQTANTANSRWVPYEYGRGKAHLLMSDQVASWFDNGVMPPAAADYLQLGCCTFSESDVRAWLKRHSCKGCVAGQPKWIGRTPKANLN